MPGQYYDSESALFYNWNRYYSPAIGRYISSDPIGLAGGLNTFGYVGQNPVNLIDPWGLIEDYLMCSQLGAAWCTPSENMAREKRLQQSYRQKAECINKMLISRGYNPETIAAFSMLSFIPGGHNILTGGPPHAAMASGAGYVIKRLMASSINELFVSPVAGPLAGTITGALSFYLAGALVIDASIIATYENAVAAYQAANGECSCQGE